MSDKFKNTKKESFLKSIPDVSLESDTDLLTLRCKFNFSYMDFNQAAGQHFSGWDNGQLVKLLDKLHNYSSESLNYWCNQFINGHSVLSIYKDFPKKSDFEHPKHVPHQVHWGRFRLENKVRLVGFIIPPEYVEKAHPKTGVRFDGNTFYVVFLDKEHVFYKTEKP
jgi:hypothetical protein